MQKEFSEKMSIDRFMCASYFGLLIWNMTGVHKQMIYMPFF